MSFIPAYLAAGIDQPDFDLRVIPIFQFPDDEHRCLEWFSKAQEARRVGLSLVQAGNTFNAEQRRGIVAGVTGLPAPDPKYAKLSVGIDTSHYRLPGFLLTRTVASAPNGSQQCRRCCQQGPEGERGDDLAFIARLPANSSWRRLLITAATL